MWIFLSIYLSGVIVAMDIAVAKCFEGGEKESSDKVKPKFKVGDWIITDKNHIWYVDKDSSSTGYLYRLVGINGKVEVAECEIVEEHSHLWTIQDAKPEDVLVGKNGWTCIFKELDGELFSSYCFMDSTKWFCETGSEAHTTNPEIIGKIHPATKKQRDLLFQKIHDAGYEWDAEKKELKQLSQSKVTKISEQGWSEGDELNIKEITKAIYFKYKDTVQSAGLECWLKSLKDRLKGE